MIDSLQAYPEYKSLGLPWASTLPTHWNVRRAKNLFRCIDVRSKTGTEERLTVSAEYGVVPRNSMKVTMFEAKSYIGHKLCWPGDLVINSLWAWGRGLGVARHHGLVSSAYGVYRLKPEFEEYASFIHHLVRSKAYHWELRTRSKGVWISRLQLTDDAFLRAPVLVPSVDEAKAITRFIRDMDRRVNAFIRNRRRLVDLLGERTVTYARRAAEQPGVPRHRLSLLADQCQRPVHREPTREYTPVGLYNRGRGMFHKQKTKGAHLGESEFFWIREGDLILSGQFAWEGAVALASAVDDGCIASHRYPILLARPELATAAYLMVFFRTPLGRLMLDCDSRGAAGRNRPLNIGTLMKEKIPTPSLETQHRIAELLYSETVLKRVIEREIALVREYRTNLIADVVTGKVDVRHLAPLPDSEDLEEVVEELESLDEAAGELEDEALAGGISHADD